MENTNFVEESSKLWKLKYLKISKDLIRNVHTPPSDGRNRLYQNNLLEPWEDRLKQITVHSNTMSRLDCIHVINTS